MSVDAARRLPFEMLVALNASGGASGELYWDDGDSLDAIDAERFALLQFEAYRKAPGVARLTVERAAGVGSVGAMPLAAIRLSGLDAQPESLLLNGAPVHCSWNAELAVALIELEGVDLLEPLELEWRD